MQRGPAEALLMYNYKIMKCSEHALQLELERTCLKPNNGNSRLLKRDATIKLSIHVRKTLTAGNSASS